MPEGYSRSRAKFSGGNSNGQGGYSQRPRGDGNSLMKIVIAVVGVVIVALAVVLLWKPLSEAVFGAGTEPTTSPESTITDTSTPEPTLSAEPTSGDTQEPTATIEPTATPVPPPPPSLEFTVSAVGDMLFDNSAMLTHAKDTSGEYDFSPMFAAVKDQLSTADITIGTLETTLAGKTAKYSSTTNYNTPETVANALKDAGFDMLNTAQTHIFDKGFDGVTKTHGFLDAAGLKHTGTYLSKDEYHDTLYLDARGTKVAILSYSSDEKNKALIGNKISFAIKHINLDTIKANVKAAREAGANAVIVMLHWGDATGKTPTDTMKTQAKKIIGYGVDLIIGSHPLYMQKIEQITTTNADGAEVKGIVAYSLGSFIAGSRTAGQDCGVILNVTFLKDGTTNAVSIKSATYVPTWVYKDAKSVYAILPVEKYKDSEDLLAPLSSTAKTRIKKVWDDVKALLGTDPATPGPLVVTQTTNTDTNTDTTEATASPTPEPSATADTGTE